MSREEQLRQLALEELAREEMEQEEKQKIERVPGQTHFVDPQTGRTTKLPQEMQPSKEQLMAEDAQMVKESTIAAGYGAAKLPFVKDVLSAGEAIIEGEQNFGEAYTRNRKEWDKNINEQAEKHPASFNVGQFGTSLLIPGVGSSVWASAVFGAAQAISDLEDRNPYAIAESGLIGASIGAGTSGAMIGIGKGIKYVGEKLGIIASNTVKEAVGAASTKELEMLNKHIRKTGSKGASAIQQTAEFSERILKTNVQGQPLLGGLSGQRYAETAQKAALKRAEYGDEIGKLVDTMEQKIKEPVDARILYDDLKNKLQIDDKLKSDIPAIRQKGEDYLTQLKSIFVDETEEIIPMIVKKPMMGSNGQPILDSSGKPLIVEEVVNTVKKITNFKKLTPKRITKMKLDHADEMSSLTKAFDNAADPGKARSLSLDDDYNMAFNRTMTETMESLNDSLATQLPEVANKYKNLNRDWSDMLMVEKLSNAKSLKEGGGALEKFKNALSVRGLLVAQVSNSTGANMALSAGVASTINEVLKSPKTTTKMANSLNILKDHLTNFKDSPFLKRIVVAASAATYDGNNEPLDKALASSASEISLMNMPMKRSLQDFKNKSDDVLQALEYHDPDMASQVREALDNNEDESLMILMDQASKNPKMKKYFEDGVGIDGRVFSEEDKAMYQLEIEKANIPLKQKLQMKDNLNKSGAIPQFQQPEDRTLKYMKRDKSKPQF